MNCAETTENEEKIQRPSIILKFKKSSYLKRFVCSGCPNSFKRIANLRYHIRREHFNLLAKITKREKREINDIWLESVVNSNDVIEIKKTGHNKYLMKKLSNVEGVEIVEPTDTIDLSPLYPDCTRPKKIIWCGICKITVHGTAYIRHLDEKHADTMV